MASGWYGMADHIDELRPKHADMEDLPSVAHRFEIFAAEMPQAELHFFSG